MRWETLRAALDLARKYGQRETKILFSGGEPLLEFALIRKAVAYTKRTFRRGKRATFALITNGTLLTEDKVAFLEKHSFEIQLSCDGVRAAQDLRAKGTFRSLDSLLGRLKRFHPDFYKDNVQISMTLVPQTARYIADSFEYFLRKGAHRIAIGPSITNHSRWNPSRIAGLERQFTRIYKMSLAHFDRTGDVPLVHFRPTEEHFLSWDNPPRSVPHAGVRGGSGRSHARTATEAKRESAADSTRSEGCVQGQCICAAGSGEILAVDVDGQVYACVLFARSYQTLVSSVLQRSAEAMSLGNLTADEFWKRYRRLPKVARRLAIFNPKQSRRTSYRLCRDCSYFNECFVCPVSPGHLSGNDDCERIPDFACAFNFTSLKYRDRFLEQVLFPVTNLDTLTEPTSGTAHAPYTQTARPRPLTGPRT